MRGDFSAGKSMLKENTGDILLVPIVVTTTDVQDFDFSIPIFKTWYVTVNAVHRVYCMSNTWWLAPIKLYTCTQLGLLSL